METRYQRVGREQRERQAAREAKLKADAKATRKAKRTAKADTRDADRVDGFDRDNMGLSPDY